MRSNKILSNAAWMIAPTYIAAIGCAELIGVFIGSIPSLLCHALLLPILLSHYVVAERAVYRRLLPALALISLLRILSLIIPIKEIPPIYWPAMIGIPLLVAVVLTLRLLGLSPAGLGLGRPAVWPQLAIAFSGLPLSLVGALILRPEPLVSRFDLNDVIIGAVILTIFAGLTEEIIFRGLLHQLTAEVYGGRALLVSTALFAIMYVGSLSWEYVLFIGLVGLFFGWCVERTRSLWGVVLAHSLLNIGMGLVWPFMLSRLERFRLFQSIIAIRPAFLLLGCGLVTGLLFWRLWLPRLLWLIARLRRMSTASSFAGGGHAERGAVQLVPPPIRQFKISAHHGFWYRMFVAAAFLVVVPSFVLMFVQAPAIRKARQPPTSTDPLTLLRGASPSAAPDVSAAPLTALPAPLATSTSTAVAVSTSSALAAPSAAPTATALNTNSGTVLLQRVAAAEAALRTGQIEATIDYGNGSKSFAQVRFDLGNDQHLPRVAITTTYQGSDGTRRSELIIIGKTSWQRQPNRSWKTVAGQEAPWGRVQNFLPHIHTIEPAAIETADKAVLRWYDAGRDADVRLRVDPSSGVPLELRQTMRATGTLLIVTYTGWNTSVAIIPPTGS